MTRVGDDIETKIHATINDLLLADAAYIGGSIGMARVACEAAQAKLQSLDGMFDLAVELGNGRGSTGA